jgi:hypothetical protein
MNSHAVPIRRAGLGPNLELVHTGLIANAKKPNLSAGLFRLLIGRLPTLPHTRACSTIGAGRLNFRVRDGNGWNPLAVITRKLLLEAYEAYDSETFKNLSGTEYFIDGTYQQETKFKKLKRTINFMVKPNELLVTVSSTCYHAYTSVLST